MRLMGRFLHVFRRVDPGWMFILSGLVICSTALLVPAQRELDETRRQLSVVKSQEQWAVNRLAAYDDFVMQLDNGDPGLIKRLALRSLNMLPKGDTPVLMDMGASEASVEQWIESTLPEPDHGGGVGMPSILAMITSGPFQPWFLAFGVACIFIGLLTSIETRASRPGGDISPE